MESWTIYDHPDDYPNHYVLRKFIGEQATSVLVLSDQMEPLRSIVADMGLVPFKRMADDDASIVETWLL